MKRIAIFAATSWEYGAVRAAFAAGQDRRIDGRRVFVGQAGAHEYWLVRTGMGLERASLAARRLFQERSFDLVLSTGFACALIEAEVGDLLVGNEVRLASSQGEGGLQAVESLRAEPEPMVDFARSMAKDGHVGTFVSVDRIVWQAVEKARYARITAAIGLDMESAALANEAGRARIPFAIVRTVSDLVTEDLPLDFNLFLRPTDWPKGVVSVLTNPSSVMGVARLRRQSRIAAARLTEFFRASVAVLSVEQMEQEGAKEIR